MSFSDTWLPSARAHLGLRRDSQPLVHRAALVSLVMAESYPAQPLGRHETPDAKEREEHFPPDRYETTRARLRDEKLIEVKPAGGATAETNVDNR